MTAMVTVLQTTRTLWSVVTALLSQAGGKDAGAQTWNRYRIGYQEHWAVIRPFLTESWGRFGAMRLPWPTPGSAIITSLRTRHRWRSWWLFRT